MRAVQRRAFVTVPFSASTLGVRIGSLALNLAEVVAAFNLGLPLPSTEFSNVTITGTEGTTIEGAVVSSTGMKVYTTLPFYENTNLDQLCPGSPAPLVIADIPREQGWGIVDPEENEVVMEQLDDGLSGWALGLLIAMGIVLFGLFTGLLLLVSRERRGQPYFAPERVTR